MTTREQILQVIEEVDEQRTTMRFGQLVANISYMAKGPTRSAVWDVEDEEFLQAARQYLAQLKSVNQEEVTAAR